jgi:uncharacterized membrane protein
MSEEHDRMIDRLARTLGWVSLGLGMAQISAPEVITRLSGIDDSPLARGTTRLVGVRELMQAAALLGSRRPAAWVWTRVAGDAMDLALLCRSLNGRAGWRDRRVMATAAAVAGITAVDLYVAACGARRRPAMEGGHPMRLHASITINRPRPEVYRYWRDFENLPRFMIHLESVEMIGDGLWHWKARGPLKSVEWDAQVVDDRPNELIAWRSTHGATVENGGRVRFADAPGGRGTEVRVHLEYGVPAGRLGAVFARLLGEHPEQQVRDDLRRFKQIMETGEVVRSEGSPEGTRAFRQIRQRPAQPVR